jgi:hypothetical protein
MPLTLLESYSAPRHSEWCHLYVIKGNVRSWEISERAPKFCMKLRIKCGKDVKVMQRGKSRCCRSSFLPLTTKLQSAFLPAEKTQILAEKTALRFSFYVVSQYAGVQLAQAGSRLASAP